MSKKCCHSKPRCKDCPNRKKDKKTKKGKKCDAHGMSHIMLPIAPSAD